MVTCLRAGMPHFGMQAWNGRIIIPLGVENLDGHFMCYYLFF
jgi:hypothetical protein